MEAKNESYQDHLEKYALGHDPAHITAAFQLVDEDRDGLISPQDLLAFPKQGEVPAQLQARVTVVFPLADENQDGHLDEKEFTVFVQKSIDADQEKESYEEMDEDVDQEKNERLGELMELYYDERNPEHLEAFFRILDTNGDGVISLEELKQSYLFSVKKDTELAARMFMQWGDTNADGVMSLSEFLTLIKQSMGDS